MTEAPAIGRSRTLGTDVSCRFSPRPERARRQLQGSGSLHITTPPKNTPSTPKPLHNPPSTPGHAGQRPPQYDHCCAPGWLSPPYQRDETTSSTHTHTHTHTHTKQWSWVWWCVNTRLRMMDWTSIAQQLFAVSRCRNENPPFKTHKTPQWRRNYADIKAQRITLMVLNVSAPLQTYFTSQMNFFVICFEISFLEFQFT